MSKRYFLLFIVLIAIIFHLSAQLPVVVQKDSLEKEGHYYYDKVDYAKHSPDSNIYFIQKAQVLFEQAEEWEYYVNCLTYLSILNYLKEDFQQAEAYSDQALQVAAQQLEESNEAYCYAIAASANMLATKGNYSKAIERYQQSIAIQSGNRKFLLGTALYYQNIGVSYRAMGDYDEALYYYRQALPLLVDTLGSEDKSIAAIYRDMGQCLHDKKQFDEAEDFYKKSLKLLETLDEQGEYLSQISLYCYQGLADIYLQKNETNRCQYFANKAITVQQQFDFKNECLSYEIMGKIYQQNGNYRQALHYFEQAAAAAAYEVKGYERHPQIALTLANIAGAYQKQEEYATALTYYQKALNALIDGPALQAPQDHPAIEDILQKATALKIVRDRGTTFLEKYQSNESHPDDLLAAEGSNKLAIQLIDQLRQTYRAKGSKFILAAEAMPVYEQAIEIALTRYEQTADPQFLETAFLHAERNKAILLLESIQERKARALSNIPKHLLEKEKTLRIDMAFYEEKINIERLKLAKPEQKISRWQEQLFAVREAHQELLLQLENSYPEYHQNKYDKTATSLAALQNQLLDKESCILEYFAGNHQLYLFEIRSTSVKVHRIESNQLASQIETLNSLVYNPPEGGNMAADYQTFTQMAHQLYNDLLAPVLSDDTDLKRLYLIPDDFLNALSFGMLLRQPVTTAKLNYSAVNMDYLIEDYSMSSHYSAALLLEQSQLSQCRASKKMIGYAPVFGTAALASGRSCSDNENYSLRCNQPEVSAIAELMGGEAQMGMQAQSSHFVEEASDYQIIHLATHACIYPDAPQLNRVYFTDDHLSSYSLANVDLQADLVVVSACNSANGTLIRGEGVMSLSRDFITAGCGATVTSLWSVDDCATSDVMIDFYKHLNQGLGKDEALRQAQLNYLQTADKLHQHPFFWSAFVQFGDIRPICNQSILLSLKSVISFSLLLFLGLLILIYNKQKMAFNL